MFVLFTVWSLTTRGESIGQCPAVVASGGGASRTDTKPPTNSSSPSPDRNKGKLSGTAAWPRAAVRRMRSLRVRREVLHEAAAPVRSDPDPSLAGEDLLEVASAGGRETGDGADPETSEASGETAELEDIVIEHATILGDRMIDFSNLTPMVRKVGTVAGTPNERPQSDAPASSEPPEPDQTDRETAEAILKKAADAKQQQQKTAGSEDSSQEPTVTDLQEDVDLKPETTPGPEDLLVPDIQEEPLISKSNANVLSHSQTKTPNPSHTDNDHEFPCLTSSHPGTVTQKCVFYPF